MQFTVKEIKAYKPPAGVGDHTVWDEDKPGFGIRYQNGGTGKWVVMYRHGDGRNGKLRKVTLGAINKVTLDKAREIANGMFGKVAESIDPKRERDKLRKVAHHSIPEWIEPFCTWLSTSRKKDGKLRAESWVAFNRFALTTHWKPLHKMPLMEIEREDVADQLTFLNESSGLASSDQCRAVLSKFFNWMIGQGKHKGFNPVTGTEKNGGKKRSRLLTPLELKKIWNGVAAKDGSLDDYGRIVRVLMLTGQRLSEIGDLSRDEINTRRKLIELPEDRTKNGLPHDIPMSDKVIELLSEAAADKDKRRHNGGPPLDDDGARMFLFGSGKSKAKGYRGWSKSKAELDDKIKLKTPWVHHDLRRACSTYMRQECHALPHHVEAVLNHVSGADKGGVAGVYNQAEYNPDKREALDRYAEWILRTVN